MIGGLDGRQLNLLNFLPTILKSYNKLCAFLKKKEFPMAKANLSKIASALKASLKEDFVVQLDDSSVNATTPHISTGSVALDYLIGGKENERGVKPCPGLPRGRITNIYGNAGAGKTTIALQTASQVCKEGGTVLYIDWENEVEPKYAQALGVPVTDKDKFMLVQPDTLETGLKYMAVSAKEGVDLIVIDSVGAAVPQAMFEKQDGETQMAVGANARVWSVYLPKLKGLIAKHNTCVIGISQLREAIGGMTSFTGPKTTPQGGKAWQYYSSLQIKLSVVQKEKGKVWDAIQSKTIETVTGSVVRAHLDKCKVSDSVHHEVDFFLMSGKGVDNERTIIDLAINSGIISKKGAWFSWQTPSGEIRSQGLAQFRDQLATMDNGLTILFNQVKPFLSKDKSADGVPATPKADGKSIASANLDDLFDGVGDGEDEFFDEEE
jgi:recombination protein RecA